MTEQALFAEVEVYQTRKHGESVCGDTFFSQKLKEEGRVIGVLSDGLGSGIKANILASLTGKMALRFSAGNLPVEHSADIIMDTLPVCAVRKISYSTFTIVDASLAGRTRVVEMGNPPFLLVRDGKAQEVAKREVASARWPQRVTSVAEFSLRPGDRLIAFSDGVTQAGLGGRKWKLGWRVEGCRDFVEARLSEAPTLSARRLAREVVEQAMRQDEWLRATPADDATCAVFYFRKPRRLLVLTGPPFSPARDEGIANRFEVFPGRKAICGGTTANIVSRELGLRIRTHLRTGRGDLPPTSEMNGVDLVTEGILTLSRTAQYLEAGGPPAGDDAAAQLAELLHESDVIHLLVGTRVNEAHQDPTLPVDLEIRRNVVKRIRAALTERFLKEVTVEYI